MTPLLIAGIAVFGFLFIRKYKRRVSSSETDPNSRISTRAPHSEMVACIIDLL